MPNVDQAAPTGLVGVAPTPALNDGQITGVTTFMEYKLSGGATYIAIAASPLTGLIAGIYKVRYAAKTGYNASPDTLVTVPIYPGGVYVPRDWENVPGVTYDATKKTRYYAEDLKALAQEIVAIETILGTEPSGAYATVKAWLSALPLTAAVLTKVLPDETPNGIILAFTFHHLPVFVNKDGQILDAGNGFSVAGTGPWILTFDNAPISILSGFANV